MLTKFDLYNYTYKSDEELFKFFDQLQPLDKAHLRGYWKGIEIETKHPLNSTLAFCDWYGKCFLNNGEVHSLIFKEDVNSETHFKIDPKNFPLSIMFPKTYLVRYLFKVVSPFFETNKTTATLRNLTYRGITSVALVYNDVDVIDYYRRIDSDTVFGVLISPTYKRPFFYLLEKDKEANNSSMKYRKKSIAKENEVLLME